MSVKSSLELCAKSIRVTAFMVENWMWIASTLCILSPISPHMSLGLLTGYPCDYIGTRGVISISAPSCPPVLIINTLNEEVVSW